MRARSLNATRGILLLAALTATACSGAGRPAPETAPSRDGASTDELEAIYRARTDSARTRFTEADVRFMTGMIAHHAQAVVMSRLAPENGASPSIRTLAARVINAQKDEIATMERWLRDRGQPVPEVHMEGTSPEARAGEGAAGDTDADHRAHGAGEAAGHAARGADETGGHRMPGMLTPEQMRELERAHGPEFDRLFLEYMIQHHQGAVTMVHELFGTDGAGQDEEAFRLASDIQVDQITEIDRMELMLSRLPAEGGR